MSYAIGGFFLLLSGWQFFITKRTFTTIRQKGNESTSSFIMLGLWGSLAFALCCLYVAYSCFFVFQF
ncbi:MAG: hypothetical protein ACTIC2_12620 [Enterococcus devriesei]|uniref:hypothetical protein n=1 Tax=Enterococcus devriesei TaxID=319970 RepID=UPI0028AE5CBF|nr:hypothetical protein [Enterococcus devriesei]